MSPSAAPNPGPESSPGGPVGWSRLVDTALRQRGAYQDDPRWVFKSGELQPQTLCRYAAGQVTNSERRATETFLARSPWALARVTSLVKGARTNSPGSLANRILRAAKTSGEVNPYRVAAKVLLESLDQLELVETIERHTPPPIDTLQDQDPLVRAACLLGLGELDAARDAFSQLNPLDGPLAELARRVAELTDEDDALVELLTAV